MVAAMVVFAAAIFLSAFLLFLVQPMLGKFILPWFGGSTGVWTACMLFFQVLLVAGYAYAHVSSRWLRPRMQMIFHLVVLAGSAIYLPIIPNPIWKPGPDSEPTLRIVLLLAVTVGIPYLALASTSPLLQSWFGKRFPGASPWRLYALSNLGSLLALIAYPFAVEPALARLSQAAWWSVGFGAFALLSALCAFTFVRGIPDVQANPAPRSARPSPGVLLQWIGLPAVASVMLLAITNQICLDIGVIPFLWVLPLGIYLLTFILAFDRPRWYHRGVFTAALVLAVLAVGMLMRSPDASFGMQIGLCTFILAVTGMICHGELYRMRPSTDRLTEYYLLISIGGALGGVFVAMIAPRIFSTFLELQLAIFACIALLLVRLFADERSMFHDGNRRPGWIALVAVFLIAGNQVFQEILRAETQVIDRARNFYGILRVKEVSDPATGVVNRALEHGRIAHGQQLSKQKREPTTYYGRITGIGLLLDNLHQSQPRRMGVVGLGVGTLATYGRAGDVIRFYEINPDVDRLAREHFTYLEDCLAGEPEIVLGDARLSMEVEPAQAYDVLVLDAFSSDAIPLHLLTREAFETYQRHLAPDGVIAVHISNKFIDLRPVLARAAEHFELVGRMVINEDAPAQLVSASSWVLLARDPDVFAPDALARKVSPLGQPLDRIGLWTDDSSNLFEVLRPAPAQPIVE
jgi:hypothetical protein